MKAGLIGYGSIGKRHVANLLSLGIADITLLRTEGSGNEHNLREIHDPGEFMAMPFDFVVVSNPTTCHYSTIMPLIRSGMNLLVEKPVVFTSREADELESLLGTYAGRGMVAYNMRFHPCIAVIRDIINEGLLGRPLSARLFVGQYLPDWRPGTDYRTGVSALKSLGGGVVLELIHEIDLAIHLFGEPVAPPKSLALKISGLETETEDISEIIYLSERNTLVSVHQDYLSRTYRRTISISGEEALLLCDLKDARVTVTGKDGSVIRELNPPFVRNDMYLSIMTYYTGCLTKGTEPEPSLEESLISLRLALRVKEDNNL
ncbi:MAG: Gfo/Idh/MocA family oxidoreductase [Bacteroidales bacterium]|jgi:predicted dehydrogenase|nr:Gfo/Idh/MocA family oxidoreductase [Bacteroidales bacterium]